MKRRDDEQRRILDLLAEGQVSADEAAALLEALKVPPPPPPPPPKSLTRALHIHVDMNEAEGGAKVDISVPLGLAKFASKFLPQIAREQLDAHGVRLDELLSATPDLSGGRIIDIDTSAGDGPSVKLVVEIV